MAEKKRVGVVDRIEGHIAVIVVKDPEGGDSCEIDISKKNLKKGDSVAVNLSTMSVEMKIPVGNSMLEMENAIEEALEQIKKEAFKNVKS